MWVNGFWNLESPDRLTFIDKQPPISAGDQIPQPPSDHMFWFPGYWEYEEGSCSWISGKWEPLNDAWMLAPASYVWRPEGYVFIPMYWDFLLEKRGRAYFCTDDITAIIQPDEIIRRLFIWYPYHTTFYWQ